MAFSHDGNGRTSFAEARAKAADERQARLTRRVAWLRKHTPDLCGEAWPFALSSLEVLEVLVGEPTPAAVRERTLRKLTGPVEERAAA